MQSLAYLRKGLYPQPVYVAIADDWTVRRMTFFSRSGKPLDIERGRRIVQMLSNMEGRRIVSGHVEIEGKCVAKDDFSVTTKRKRGPSAKVYLTALKELLDNPGYDTRRKALELVEQAA